MTEVLGAALFALGGALLILLILARWGRAAGPVPATEGPAVFLFQGDRLVEATAAARRHLRGRSGEGSDLSALLGLLARGFGADLSQRVAALPGSGRLLVASEAGDGSLEAEREQDALRLTLRLGEGGNATLERLSHEAAREELALLRALAEDAPQLIWITDGSGAVTWANRSYLARADLGTETDARRSQARRRAAWPAAPLFEPLAELADGEAQTRRLSLARPGPRDPAWFDVTAVRRGPDRLHFATEVSGLVRAEAARVEFVQALSKTFADLATGLAVFDRHRRLVLFNPALLDLTGLSAEVLSARPSVATVLDRLREVRAVPEPRDFGAWRDEIAALEARASRGGYREDWTLPSGRTLRVTGRPHPDGAVAFLFEDVSDELDQIRRLRTELATAHAALRARDGAVAMFGPDGTVVLSNPAYAELWGAPPPGGVLGQERGRWAEACEPGPSWDELDRALAERAATWMGSMRRGDGRALRLRFVALAGGATLVSFDPLIGPEVAGAALEPAAVPARPARRRAGPAKAKRA